MIPSGDLLAFSINKATYHCLQRKIMVEQREREREEGEGKKKKKLPTFFLKNWVNHFPRL